jgi:hypothetical protein
MRAGAISIGLIAISRDSALMDLMEYLLRSLDEDRVKAWCVAFTFAGVLRARLCG